MELSYETSQHFFFLEANIKISGDLHPILCIMSDYFTTDYILIDDVVIFLISFSGGSRFFEKGGRGNDKVTLGLLRLNINV